jgi:hypothetical protein
VRLTLLDTHRLSRNGTCNHRPAVFILYFACGNTPVNRSRPLLISNLTCRSRFYVEAGTEMEPIRLKFPYCNRIWFSHFNPKVDTMAPALMNDHADDKPKLYYGVRKCESLEGPAIFLNWEDCKFFVGSEKDDNIEFQSFERIVDAASYVTFQQEAAANDIHPITPQQGCLLPLTSLKRSADQASLSSAAPAGGSPKKRPPRIPTLAAITETEPIDPDDIDLLFSDSADGDHADASTTDEVDTSRAFERQLASLKEYISVYGTTSGVAVERFMSLNTFMAEWRLKASNIAEGRTKQTSASFTKIQQLIDLGVDLGVDPKTICEPVPPASLDGSETAIQVTLEKPRSQQSKSFEQSLQLLKEYKDAYGTTVLLAEHCQGQFEHLRKFLYEWRTVRAAQGETQRSGASTESRIHHRRVSLGYVDGEEQWQTQASTDACIIENHGAPGKPCIWRPSSEGKTQRSPGVTESRIRRLVSLGYLDDEEELAIVQAKPKRYRTHSIHQKVTSPTSEHVVIPAITLCPSFLIDITRIRARRRHLLGEVKDEIIIID